MNSDIVTIARLYEDLERRLDLLKRDPARVVESRRIVDAALTDGNTYYGINTGFGVLANKRIDAGQVKQLQRNLLLSHAVGVGDLVPKDISRLILLLKIHALGLGYSGVSPDTFARLVVFADRGLIPAIPSKGSVGASGDLAPLAHMSLPLLGLGFFWNDDGSGVLPARDVLDRHGLGPIELQAKDGLSLVNGTQLMAAYGAHVLERSIRLVKLADILAAASLEALQAGISPFDQRIHQLRPHPGQQEAAANVRRLLAGSDLLDLSQQRNRVQDPYSLRCVPQVHGASRDALRYAQGVVQTEINSATDNPLVLADGEILSGGNFHGQPVALALDLAAIALAELAAISERRTYLLLGGHSGLPTLLVRETGVNSGLMMPQYTAAALVSENKVLCHPASVDSIPTSLGQEDHVSMGSISALKLLRVFDNVVTVLGTELFTVTQALDYRLPARLGRGVDLVHAQVRALVPHQEADYWLSPDLLKCIELVGGTSLLAAVEQELGALA
jgi:histidine ammonia-lyase